VQDRLFVTPFPGEPVGWITEQVGDRMLCFSSDYPHPEGTRDPVGRFEATMTGSPRGNATASTSTISPP